MKASISFFPNPSKRNSRTNKIPLYLRVIFDRSKAEARLNAELSDNELSRWNLHLMRLNDKQSQVNDMLNSIESKFKEFLILNSTTLPRYTATKIRDVVMGTSDKNKTVGALFYAENYYQKAVVNNKQFTNGTIKNYRKALNHLKHFLEYKKISSAPVSDLNNAIAFDFKNYLLSDLEMLNKKGMTEASALGIVKKFRTIYDQAISEGLLKENPFKTIKLKAKSPRRQRLTLDDVKKIIKTDLAIIPHLNNHRNLFLFSVFTGLSYHDIISLKSTNLSHMAGNVKLTIRRKKTDILTECFLISQAQNILEVYKGTPEIEIRNTLLPYISNKQLNLQLKVLGSLSGISVNITMHVARHTFRQLLAEAGIVDQGVIKRLMGHSRGNDIDEVYYSITEKSLLDASKRLQNIL